MYLPPSKNHQLKNSRGEPNLDGKNRRFFKKTRISKFSEYFVGRAAAVGCTRGLRPAARFAERCRGIWANRDFWLRDDWRARAVPRPTRARTGRPARRRRAAPAARGWNGWGPRRAAPAAATHATFNQQYPSGSQSERVVRSCPDGPTDRPADRPADPAGGATPARWQGN